MRRQYPRAHPHCRCLYVRCRVPQSDLVKAMLKCQCTPLTTTIITAPPPPPTMGLALGLLSKEASSHSTSLSSSLLQSPSSSEALSSGWPRLGGGGGEKGKCMKKKSPNKLLKLTKHKQGLKTTNKAQASRLHQSSVS